MGGETRAHIGRNTPALLARPGPLIRSVARTVRPAGEGDFPIGCLCPCARNSGPECPGNPRTRMSALPSWAHCWWLALGLMAAFSTGCQTLGYYAQAIHGQYEIVSHREPMAKLL